MAGIRVSGQPIHMAMATENAKANGWVHNQEYLLNRAPLFLALSGFKGLWQECQTDAGQVY